MKQILSGRCIQNPITTEDFVALLGTSSISSKHNRSPWSVAGTFRNLVAKLSAVPGAGRTISYTLQINGADTAVTVTFGAADTQMSDLTHSVSIAVGDDVRFRRSETGTGSSPSVNITHYLEFEGTTAKESGYTGLCGIAPGGATWATWGASAYHGICGMSDGASDSWDILTNHYYFEDLIPIAGAITRYDVHCTTSLSTGTAASPGASTGWTFTLYLNDVKQDGSGGTVNTQCTLTGAATSANWTGSLPIVAGDRVYLQAALNTALPANTRCLHVGVRFTATRDGDFFLMVSSTTSSAAARFVMASSGSDWNATESSITGLSGPTTFYISDLISKQVASVGAGNQWTVSVRKNLATPTGAPYVIFSDVSVGPGSWHFALACSTTSAFGAIAIVDGDTWGLRSIGGTSIPPQVTLGPLAWVEFTRRVVGGSGEFPAAFNFYSDDDMQCPGTWYGGFKEGRVTRWGTAERSLSDPWTGDWQGGSFSFSVSDYDVSLRQRLDSVIDRYWTVPCVLRMTTRDTRAALGTPYTVFVGPILDAQPTRPLGFDITLGDSISSGLLSDQFQLPWRQVRDSFLSQLVAVAEDLDVDTPIPIIYGEHRRVAGVDPPSPQGFVYQPTLLGTQVVGLGLCYVWLVAGHAVADILDVYVDGVSILAGEGTTWLVPHFGGWAAEFTDPYVDYASDTYATFQRYTLIYGLVGSADPDGVADGSKTLTIALQGVEPVGDGSGAVITDRIQQYKHFAVNFLAYQGLDSYQFGPWLTNPTWALFDVSVPIVEEQSFDDCTAIGELRLPSVGSPATVAGYIGAAIIGARSGDRLTARDWIAQWNRSCSVRFGITHQGQMRVVMLHPTAAIKAAAPLFTDGYEIVEQSFGLNVRWDQQATSIPFKADYEHSIGQWQTLDIAIDYTAQLNYGRTITAEAREYPFAPGITMAAHLALMELRLRADPPREITLTSDVDPDGLGTLELGDYFRYMDYATIAGSPAEIRLAQVQSMSIAPGPRQVTIVAIDCEDHIDYDAAE